MTDTCFKRGSPIHKRPLIDNSDGTFLVPLPNAIHALIDAQDVESVAKYNWSMNGVSVVTNGPPRMHLARLIMQPPPGFVVDHRNHDKLDNRRTNLRICRQAQNNMNRRSFKGRSKYKGVYLDQTKNKWAAQIQHKRKLYWLGYYRNEVEAAIVYNVAAQLLHADFSQLNRV